MAELSTDIREAVRGRYARAATASAAGRYTEAAALESEAGCCAAGSCDPGTADSGVWGADCMTRRSATRLLTPP
jgi:hypothetical protein